jgi:hypothetical protein
VLAASGGTATSAFNISGPTATQRNLSFQSVGSTRWQLQANAAPEGGGNTGSDFQILAFDDTGAQLALTPLTIGRATGLATVQGDPVVSNGIATKNYVDLHSVGGITNPPTDGAIYGRVRCLRGARCCRWRRAGRWRARPRSARQERG